MRITDPVLAANDYLAGNSGPEIRVIEGLLDYIEELEQQALVPVCRAIDELRYALRHIEVPHARP